MKATFSYRRAAVAALVAATLFGVSPTAHAFTRGAVPVVYLATCNGGNLSTGWTLDGGKPVVFAWGDASGTLISSTRISHKDLVSNDVWRMTSLASGTYTIWLSNGTGDSAKVSVVCA